MNADVEWLGFVGFVGMAATFAGVSVSAWFSVSFCRRLKKCHAFKFYELGEPFGISVRVGYTGGNPPLRCFVMKRQYRVLDDAVDDAVLTRIGDKARTTAVPTMAFFRNDLDFVVDLFCFT